MSTAVAISTTGDEHRLAFLQSSAVHWCAALGRGDSLFVTVDGDEAAVERAYFAVEDITGSVFRVGQADPEFPFPTRDGRLGVAVNKNTGLELMMANTGAEHLFLSDDDTYPLSADALDLHRGFLPHSMVCWGKSRLASTDQRMASWTWPRGVVLYQTRRTVELVGGMIEAFGPGGHEHVEYSRRIHQSGLTPVEFPSPAAYANGEGNRRSLGIGARRFWHAEDMPRLGEPLGNLRLRKKGLTSVRRQDGDWAKIEKIMADRDGDTSPVPYTARENGRLSATLWENDTPDSSRGADQ